MIIRLPDGKENCPYYKSLLGHIAESVPAGTDQFCWTDFRTTTNRRTGALIRLQGEAIDKDLQVISTVIIEAVWDGKHYNRKA